MKIRVSLKDLEDCNCSLSESVNRHLEVVNKTNIKKNTKKGLFIKEHKGMLGLAIYQI